MNPFNLVLCAIVFVSSVFGNVEYVFNDLYKQSIIYGIATVVSNSSDNLCFEQLKEFKYAVEQKHQWSLQALDASGHKSPGFYWGNNFWLGSRSQCMDLMNKDPYKLRTQILKNNNNDEHDYPPYPVTYAVVRLHHSNDRQMYLAISIKNTVHLGLCLPKSCNEQDASLAVEQYFLDDSLPTQSFYNLSLEVKHVKLLNDQYDWLRTNKATVLITFILLPIFLVILGTAFDLIKKHADDQILTNVKVLEPAENTLEKLILCFSIRRNIKFVLNTKASNNEIPVLHGLRLFSMFWVIATHTVLYSVDFINNFGYAFRLSESFLLQIVANGQFCVDTFFVLSGFLMAYIYFKNTKQFSKKYKTSKQPSSLTLDFKKWIFSLFHRYLRLTPTYAFTIVLATFVTLYYYNESVFHPSERNDLLCENYWWRNVLYVNNLYPHEKMCMTWSWYLSADTQFFVASSLLLSMLATRHLKFLLGLLTATIFVCIGVTSYNSYAIKFVPYLDEQLNKVDAIYHLPWNRAGPYIVGILASYLYVVKLEEKLILRKRYLWICWIIFPVLNLWILFALYERVDVKFSAFYVGMSRILWGIGIAWFLIACCTNNAGVIGKFLSHPAWIPLSKLTYSAYLLNPLIVLSFNFFNESPQHSSISTLISTILSNLLGTFSVALLFCLVFECPYANITKIIKMHLQGKPSVTMDAVKTRL